MAIQQMQETWVQPLDREDPWRRALQLIPEFLSGKSHGQRNLTGYNSVQFSSVQLLSCVWLFATPWNAAGQVLLSITNSWSLLKLTSIALVMPSNHLILCHPFSSCLQSFPASLSFPWLGSLHQVAKVLELQLQHQSFWWIFRVDFL